MTPNSETADPAETHRSGQTDPPTRLTRVRSIASKRGRNGTVSALAGVVLLAAAVRSAGRDRRRAGVFALGGGVLLGGWLRRRGSDARGSAAGGDDAAAGESEAFDADDEGRVSADARVHLERADVQHQPETNPRGVSGEPDVETETDPDEGDIRFTTEQEVDRPVQKPHLDGHANDPRLYDEDDPNATDEHVEISLSESAMADEASEAVGPADEQAYPASEGTDPEPMSDKAPPRYGEGAVENKGLDSEDIRAGEGDREVGEEPEPDGEEGT